MEEGDLRWSFVVFFREGGLSEGWEVGCFFWGLFLDEVIIGFEVVEVLGVSDIKFEIRLKCI